jgi:hypothetical protein
MLGMQSACNVSGRHADKDPKEYVHEVWPTGEGSNQEDSSTYSRVNRLTLHLAASHNGDEHLKPHPEFVSFLDGIPYELSEKKKNEEGDEYRHKAYNAIL